jgi:hypothetical protein
MKIEVQRWYVIIIIITTADNLSLVILLEEYAVALVFIHLLAGWRVVLPSIGTQLLSAR